MRKIKFLLAMALLVFVFSGCGGSAGDDSESTTTDTESVSNTEVSSTLTGDWLFDESSTYTGKATAVVNGTDKSITLYHVMNFKLSFSNINFSNNDEGTADVFYSFVSKARDEDNNSLGNFSTKSYADETSTTRTKRMIISRVTDEEWILSSTESGVPTIIINFTSSTATSSALEKKISVQLTGREYMSALNTNCNYTIECSFTRKSSTPTTDDIIISDDVDVIVSADTTLSDILTGTWLLNSEGTATATNTSTGETFNLSTSTGTKIAFSDVVLNTSQAGNSKVFYANNWQALDSNGILAGAFSVKSYSNSNATDKMRTMTLVYVSDDQWRLETENLSLNVTINSETEITTKWEGITKISSLSGNYHYSIECSFRKTSSAPSTVEDWIISDDVVISDDSKTLADILKGTWLLHTEYESTATNAATAETLTLSTSTGTKIAFSDIVLNTTEAGTAKVFYSNNWQALDSSGVLAGLFRLKSYTDSNATDKTQSMSIIYVSDDQWRFSSNSGVLNLTLTIESETEIRTKWEGYSSIESLGGNYNYSIECSFRKSNDTPSFDDITISDDLIVDDESIEDILTGTWLLHTEGTATATNTATGTALNLDISTGTRMAFSSVVLDTDEAGEANIFYSNNWQALNSSGILAGIFSIKSYSDSNASDKTQSFTFVNVTDDEWRFETTGLTINLTIVSETEISTKWEGYSYIQSLGGYYSYSIECSFRKRSDTASFDDIVITSNDTVVDDSNIADILAGTWLLHTEGTATATNTSNGTALTLDGSMGTKIVFSDTVLSTSEAGSSSVFYSNNWQALNNSGILAGIFSIKSYTDSTASDKTQSMNLIKISDSEWRLDTTGLAINITIVSDTEISTKWNGYAYINSLGGNYHYSIECSFRKSSDTLSFDDIVISDDVVISADNTIDSILKGTWLLHTEGDATATGATTGKALTLSMSSGSIMAFSNITFNSSETATTDVFYLQNWRALDSNGILDGNFVLSSDTGSTTQTMNLIYVADNEWRLESTSSPFSVNITVVSDTEISTTWHGLVYIPSLGSDYIFSIECSYRKTSEAVDYSVPEINSNDKVVDAAKDILEGNWKLTNEESTEATSTTQGDDVVLELRLASDVYLNLSNIAFSSGKATSSRTGTVSVNYGHNWTAFDTDGNKLAGTFAFSGTKEMNIAQVSDAVWRIDDKDNPEESITITINSDTDISVEWNGIATTLSGTDYADSYYYEIEASFRKE